METKKLTFNIPEDELLSLKAFAKRRSWTVTDSIRRSVSLRILVDEELAKGNKILIQGTDGETKLVNFQ